MRERERERSVIGTTFYPVCIAAGVNSDGLYMVSETIVDIIECTYSIPQCTTRSSGALSV